MNSLRRGELGDHSVRPLLVSLLTAVLAAGCSGDEPSTPMAPDAAGTTSPGVDTRAAASNGWDLPLKSSAVLARTFPGRPCRTSPHRQFDFWVGEWNVYGTDSDAFFGTNLVTSELDGCLVQEHWTGSNGNRGRSLNVYDPETSAWHQDWASQVPQGFTGRLRTSGGLEGGVMVLTGQRDATIGGIEFSWSDEWTWTPTPEGHVIQTGYTFAGDPFGFAVQDFSATYKRGDVTPPAERETDFCQEGAPGGATRQADFLVGSWDVSGAPGPSLGESSVETDLRDCLFVERFESRGGLRSVAFTYWDYWADAWFRVYVDSEGERLALRGGFEGESLVLEGTEPSSEGDVEVRVTWTPDGADVLQTWEVSRDGGASWKETARLVYRPR